MGTKIEFGHAAFTDDPANLRLIRSDPAINLAACFLPPGEMTSAYLDSLDLNTDFAKVPLYVSRGHVLNIKQIAKVEFDRSSPITTDELIQTHLTLMPERAGLVAFAEEVIQTTKLFCEGADVEKAVMELYLNYPKGTSLWHSDGRTDLRGLRAWKGHTSLWRPNHTVTSWKGLDDGSNNFGLRGIGRPGETNYVGEYYSIPPHYFTVWKGMQHREGSLIHAEPVFSDNPEPRLIQVLDIPQP